jgi:FixJ family two-component response regulator
VARGRRAPVITTHKTLGADGSCLSADKSGKSCLQDRNLVLVVDDDLGILRGVRRLLRQHAYEPILFSSAEAFKNHTDFKKVVCVIFDINLPDGSGIELRHGLKAAGIRVPVIYMTGNEDPAIRKAALDSGCIAFLTKPFSVLDLIEPLKSVGGHPNGGDTHE